MKIILAVPRGETWDYMFAEHFQTPNVSTKTLNFPSERKSIDDVCLP